ncbi:MAG: hemerythrin domain-containing protein [Myxococcota bacterium]
MTIRATEQLKRDHRALRDLFSEYLSTRGHELQLLREIRTRLELHSQLEEELFYPALAEVERGLERVQAAQRDHREVRELLDELSLLKPDDEAFDRTMRQLIQVVEAHVALEESALFPVARDDLGTGRLDEMGEEMELRRLTTPRPPVPPARGSEHHP